MLVFGHLNPRGKRDRVATVARDPRSLKSVREEVSKCRVWCASHHHKQGIRQFGYKKWPAED